MSKGATLKIDAREFTDTLRKYTALSRHTPAEVANKKAYFITRRASWYTKKADKKSIKSDLGRFIKGQFKATTKTRFGRYGQTYPAPFVALIINARRGRKGLPGLWGPEMAKAIDSFMAARMRSVAFLKAGWLDSIKKLAGVVDSKRGAPPIDREAKSSGKLGDAQPARDSAWSARATFENSASAKHDKTGALEKFGLPALQKAFDEESRDTMQEVERRLKKAAHDCGLKTS